jgi:hypothetical protein
MVILRHWTGAALSFLDVTQGRGCRPSQSVVIRLAFLLVLHGHVWHGKRGDSLVAIVA